MKDNDVIDYKKVLDALPDAVALASGDISRLSLEYANSAFFEMTKHCVEIGGNLLDFVCGKLNVKHCELDILERLLESENDSEEIVLREKDTEEKTFVMLKSFGKGRLLFILIDEKRHNFALHTTDISNLDMVSGLPNRSSFFAEYKSLIGGGKSFALVLLDLDNMKTINDAQGHEKGDSLIKHSSEILSHFAKENIRVFRYGDDEFVLLVSGLENRNYIATVADAVQEAFRAENISVSGGIAVYPSDSENENDLLKYADVTLYEAKAAGKNTILFFQSIMYQKFSAKIAMEYHLSKAFEQKQFQLYFQPQYDVKSNTLRGFEALIRWHDDDLGWISPEKFIPIAEQMNLVVPLGSWVLEQACKTLHEWQTQFGFKGIMSVNVSPIQLKKGDFIFEVKEAIAKYDIAPETLELEITEGVLIENPKEIIAQLQELKDMGIGISLDDFGTGYSSLRYLQILPLTTLKIDKSFITNLTSLESVEANITDSIISMVTKMGLDTIAEGVEMPEQLKVLKDLNCHNIQGFLKGRPMPKEECESIIS